MVDRQQAQEIASLRASALLLDEYDVQVADEADRWAISFVPRARVRGGGFQMLVAKATGEISQIVRFQ